MTSRRLTGSSAGVLAMIRMSISLRRKDLIKRTESAYIDDSQPDDAKTRRVEHKRKVIRMLKIWSRHSHPVVGIPQVGLTSATAAALASIPFVKGCNVRLVTS